jgi:hypothetical protein
MTVSKRTLSKMTLSKRHSAKRHSAQCCYAVMLSEYYYAESHLMLSVTNKPIMMSVVMMSVVAPLLQVLD